MYPDQHIPYQIKSQTGYKITTVLQESPSLWIIVMLMPPKPFFQRISNIYLLTDYQRFKSKFLKHKIQYEENLRRRVFQMLKQQSEADLIQNGEETIVKVKTGQTAKKMDIIFHYEYPVDQNNNRSIICKEAELPQVSVAIKRHTIEARQAKNIKIQLFLCEYYEKEDLSFYKVIFDGLQGEAVFTLKEGQLFRFEEIKIIRSSRDYSTLHLMVAMYHQTEEQRTWLDLYCSQPLFVTEDCKIMLLDSKEAVLRYLDEFGIENISPTRKLVVYSNIAEEAVDLQGRFSSRIAKLLNLLYLAFKYHYNCEIFFRKTPQNVASVSKSQRTTKIEQQYGAQKLAWYWNIVEILISVKAHFLKDDDGSDDGKLFCNHLNPRTKMVFRIINPLTKVRFVIAESFTEQLCIINGEKYDLALFRKLQVGDIKNVYRLYLNTLKRIKKYKLFKHKLKGNQKRAQSEQSQEGSESDQQNSQSSMPFIKQQVSRKTRGQQLKIQSKVHQNQDSQINDSENTPIIKKTRGRKAKNKSDFSKNNESNEIQIIEAQQAPHKKRVYLTDMKRLVESSKQFSMELKKRERLRESKPIQPKRKVQEEQISERIVDSSSQVHKRPSKSITKGLNISKAFQITYCFNSQDSTTTFEMNNSIFINYKSSPKRRYRDAFPAYSQHDYSLYNFCPYNHQNRSYQPRHNGSYEGFDCYHPQYSRMEHPIMGRRQQPRIRYNYSSPSPQRRKTDKRHHFEESFHNHNEDHVSRQENMRSNFERKKAKPSK